MEIVIKIDEEDFEIIKHNVAVNNPLCPLSEKEMVTKIANGVSLPEGHGDLIDRNKIGLTDFDILLCNNDYKEALKLYAQSVEDAPTIIAGSENK